MQETIPFLVRPPKDKQNRACVLILTRKCTVLGLAWVGQPNELQIH